MVGVVRIVSAPPLLPLRIKELPESVGIAIPMHNCIIAFFMSPAYAKLLKGKTLFNIIQAGISAWPLVKFIQT